MLHLRVIRRSLVVIISLLLPLYFFAQQKSPEDALEQYKKYPAERIFIQFDRTEYLAGEIMHFKAWVFVQSSLSFISTNLYIEWLDVQKKTLYRTTIPLVGGVGEGSIAIAKELPENVYYFRAYTTWLLNFSEAQQFIQPVAVYNPSSKLRLEAPAEAWTASVHPESGVLLDGIESDVAVRLKSFAKLKEQWSGYVFENADSSKKLSEFQSMNEEIGLFTFTPAFGKNYQVKVTDASGHTAVLALPAVQKQGVALKAVSLAEGIGFRISCKALPQQLKNYKIVAQLQGSLLYSATIPTAKEEINGLIPVDTATKGLVQLTIFDTDGNAVAERLCFVNLHSILFKEPAIAFTRFTSESKKNNEWKVTVDSLRADSYSFLVEDATKITNSKNILTIFWLDGLTSPPQKTGWYFARENKNAGASLDALLLSEKWSLFNWKQLMNKPVSMRFFPDNYLTYQGTASLKGKPLSNEKITLLFQLKDSSRILTDITTDSNGNFRLKSLYFFDSAKVFFHLTNNKNAAIKIDVELRRSEIFSAYKAALPTHGFNLLQRNKNDTLPQNIKNEIAAIKLVQSVSDGYKTMDAVQIKSTARTKADQLNKKLSTPMFQSPGEVVFDFINEEQETGASGILEWLGGRAPGVTPEAGGEITIRGQKPAVYIDEFLDDGNPSRLSMIPVTEIAMIKVIRNSYLIGAGGAAVIAVYTKRGDMFPSSQMRNPVIPAKTVLGYSLTDKFKPLSYGTGITAKTGYDTRSVLYFNTAVIPEKDKAVINFYNNDISKKIQLTIIGFTSGGQLVYLNKEVELK